MNKNLELIPSIALAWQKSGRRVAIATVIETWGSAPRPVGAQLAISSDGQMMGSVSGGCVEGSVIESALTSINSGVCEIVEFGVTNETAFSVGLSCGGRIRIMIEPIQIGNGLNFELLSCIDSHLTVHKPCMLITDIISFDRVLIGANKSITKQGSGNIQLDLDVLLAKSTSKLLPGHFVNFYSTPLKLIIVGGVHIAQFLTQLARLVGFKPIIIDPREAFASSIRFPEDKLINDWPDVAIENCGLDESSAVVLLTHDPKLDDPALIKALDSNAFYIGCLGSKKTHAKRVERLIDKGISADDIKNIHAPIGLDIGASTPAEIALAIIAEITFKFRKIKNGQR